MESRGKRDRSRNKKEEKQEEEAAEKDYRLIIKSNLKTILEHFVESEIKKM